jgi:type I restriction enzyme S subunit
MGEWKEISLGDLIETGYCIIKNNMREPLSKMQRDQMKNGILYPYYGAAGAIDYINDFKLDGFHLLIAEDGTVTSNGVAPMLQLVDGKFWVSNHAHILQCKSKWQTMFLYFLLLNLDINPFITGAVQPKLNKANLLTIPLLLPEDENEQKAIASVLSSLDDKIDLLHRQNKTLEAMAETLFRQWFVEEASDDWEEVPLGNSSLATIIKSGIHYFEGEKIYLETGDVDNTEIKGGKPITYKNRPSRANMEPLPYSVWFAKKGGVRKLLMFDDYAFNINDLILSTGFTGLKTTKLSHYYLWCYLLSSEFQDIKDNFISGSVQPDINNESLLQIMVLKPENETLIKFNQIVENYFHKISINRKQISVLERLRDTLLPKLMSGEVRVKI